MPVLVRRHIGFADGGEHFLHAEHDRQLVLGRDQIGLRSAVAECDFDLERGDILGHHHVDHAGNDVEIAGAVGNQQHVTVPRGDHAIIAATSTAGSVATFMAPTAITAATATSMRP